MSTSESEPNVLCRSCYHRRHAPNRCPECDLWCDPVNHDEAVPTAFQAEVITKAYERLANPERVTAIKAHVMPPPYETVASQWWIGVYHPLPCANCGHLIQRLDNQWRCSNNCQCTMQGCCAQRGC